jgi:AcrR family transcriptional regulator
MARTNDKAPMRKREILKHFRQVLVKEGIEGASMAKIASSMGIHPSLLVHYFKTKDDMIVELVDYILEQYEKLVKKRTNDVSDPHKRLNALLEMVFDVDWISQIDTREFNACYYLALRNARVMQRLRKMYNFFRETLSGELGRYMDMGIIPKGDPEKSAEIIILCVEGLSLYRNIRGGEKKYHELGRDLKNLVMDMLRRNNDTR